MMQQDEYQDAYEQWAEHPLINDAVLAAADLIDSDDHSSFLLHVIVDDDNLDDHFFDLDDADRRAEYDQASDHERAVFDALAALTERGRVTAVRIHDGMIDRAGNERAPAWSTQSSAGLWLP